MNNEAQKLKDKVLKALMPAELKEKLLASLDRLNFSMRVGGGASYGSYEQTATYIDWVVSLPWEKESADILDIARAKMVFDKNHYGLNQIKARILEFLSVIILQRKSALESSKSATSKQFNPSTSLGTDSSLIEQFSPLKSTITVTKPVLHAPILCFVGLVGTGKTTMAVSVAEALNRQIIRIPFGGLASSLDLRGLSRVHPEAEPGIVIKSLRRVNVKNPVVLLDELDRVSDEKRQEIMGVLIELLDPEQNKAFSDHYIDFPFDLSGAIFVATANNINKVSTAVIDRMEVIQMPSYTDEEKIHIGSKFLLPKALEEAGLSSDHLKVEESTWPILIRPLGFDAGIRTLKRITQGMVRKAAWKILNHEGSSFAVNTQNYREFME